MKAVEHGFSNCGAQTTTGMPSIIYSYEAPPPPQKKEM